MSIKPRTPVPELDLPLADGGRFRLADSHPPAFTMIVFYRGFHCPICRNYLRDLERRLDEFTKHGVAAVAVSSDTQERAEKTRTDWGIQHLPLAYGLPTEQGRAWGLFVSSRIKEDEPPLFIEPGLFLTRPDLTLYASSIQTMPFARPSFGDVLAAVEFVTTKNYPARGEA